MSSFQSLEQERHHLKRELHERDYNYESRMQDLQHELQHMRGQLSNVQKASKNHEQNSKSTLHDLNYQNNSLVQELDQVFFFFIDLSNFFLTSCRWAFRVYNLYHTSKKIFGKSIIIDLFYP